MTGQPQVFRHRAPKVLHHSKGQEKCNLCGIRQLRVCAGCGRRSLHRAGGDDVCEYGCSQVGRVMAELVADWRREMREALARAGVPAGAAA